jgi:hypothetical protein
MGGYCPELFDKRSFDFIKSTLSFNKKNRRYFYDTIAEHPNVTLIVLKSRRQVRRFLKKL